MVLLDIMKSVKFRFSPSGYCLSAAGLTRSNPGWMFCISKYLFFFEHPPLKISEAHKCCHRKDKKDEHEKGLKLVQKIEKSLPGERNGSHTKAKKDEHVYELKFIEELLRSMVKFKYEEKDLLSDGEDLDVLYKRWKIFFNINEAGNEKEEEQRKRTFQQNVRQVYFRNNKLKLPCPYPKLSLGKFSHLPGNSALGGLLEILYYTSPTSAVLEDGRTVDFVEFRADEFVPFDCKVLELHVFLTFGMLDFHWRLELSTLRILEHHWCTCRKWRGIGFEPPSLTKAMEGCAFLVL